MNKSEEYYEDDWSDFINTIREECLLSKVIFSVILLIVFIASVIGNSFTCIVIIYEKTLHTATNCYLFNLAISDLLATFLMFQFFFHVYNENFFIESKCGGLSCRFLLCINFITLTFLWNYGILVITALSIERYIAICYPMTLSGKSAWRRVAKIMVAIWTIAILETVPVLWTVELVKIDKNLQCFMLSNLTSRTITGISAVTTFVIPLCILIFVYTMIGFRVNENQNNRFKHTVYKNGYKKKNVNKLIALTVSFVVCWLPFFLIKMTIFASGMKKFNVHRWTGILSKIALFNSCFTTVLNPLLFSVMSVRFRKAAKMLWQSKIKRCCKHTDIQNDN